VLSFFGLYFFFFFWFFFFFFFFFFFLFFFFFFFFFFFCASFPSDSPPLICSFAVPFASNYVSPDRHTGIPSPLD